MKGDEEDPFHLASVQYSGREDSLSRYRVRRLRGKGCVSEQYKDSASVRQSRLLVSPVEAT